MSDYKFKTIWKFKLSIEPYQRISVQTATKPIHLGYDLEGSLCMWAEVDPDKNKRDWEVWIVPTGGTIPEDTSYLGSFARDWFVGHVYAKPIL